MIFLTSAVRQIVLITMRSGHSKGEVAKSGHYVDEEGIRENKLTSLKSVYELVVFVAILQIRQKMLDDDRQRLIQLQASV